MEHNETCKVSDCLECVIWCVRILFHKWANTLARFTVSLTFPRCVTVCLFKHHLRWHHVQTHSKQQPKCSDGASPISPDTHEPWKHDVRSLVHNELRGHKFLCMWTGTFIPVWVTFNVVFNLCAILGLSKDVLREIYTWIGCMSFKYLFN